LKEVEFSENRMCLIKINVDTTILGSRTEVPSDEGITTFKICCHWQLCCSLPPFLNTICWSSFNDTTLLALSVVEKMDKNLWTYVSGRIINISREMWHWFNKWDFFFWCYCNLFHFITVLLWVILNFSTCLCNILNVAFFYFLLPF